MPTIFAMGCATTGRPAYEPVRSADAPRLVTDAPAGAPPTEAESWKGPVLERAEFVRSVLDRNPSIESARQAWRAAVARVRRSGLPDDPMVTADMAPLTIGSSHARFSWEATLSQRFPWPGKLSLDGAVTAAEADAAKSDLEASRRDLALTAALLYDEYFLSARSIEVNAHHVELLRSMRAAATAAYETGRGSAQDPLQAEFELAHMEHDTVIVASERDVIVAQMNELLHRLPGAPLPPPPATLPSPSAPDVVDSAGLEGEAVARRPEIVSARDRARAEELRAERAGREGYPDVTVSTAYSAFWDVPEQRWTVGLEFNLPVIAGRRAGAADEAQAMRAQFEADAARLADAARTQVVIGLKHLEESEHVVRLYEQRLMPIAEDEVSAARAAFAASQTPFVSVVEAEKNLRTVELEMQTARADVDRRRAELDHALGRIPGLDGRGATP